MRVMIVMGNQELYVIWKIFNILNILTRTIYLMPPPLIMVKILLMTKVINRLRKEGASQITIHHLQCMFIIQNISYKILMLISSRKVLRKEKTSVWYKKILDQRILTYLK